MEPADKDRTPHFSLSLLGLPVENDVFAEEENDCEFSIKPKSSPLPRRRSSSSDEGSEPPLNVNRKVSFADAFGLELVSVREYDKWDVGGSSLVTGAQEERAPLEQCLLLPLFELPSSPEELKQKLYPQKVELESAEFPPGTACMKGLIRVLNISYEKLVYIRMSLNNWESYYDILADYVPDSCDGETDQFTFKILLVPPYLKDGAKVEFAIRYETHDATYWANNDHKNYVILCHKKDDPNGNEKLQEELDDRNLKSCLKTSYSKEILETSCDDDPMFLTSIEAQQENSEMILEMKTIPQWNTESLLNENTEVKSKQQLDTQIHPPLHISLTNPRGQETHLTQLEGLHFYVKVENEKNAAIVSDSPINQQKDIEIEHIKFESANNNTENKVKQEEESEWVGIPSASNRNTPNHKSHERDINTAETTDSANVATSTNNILIQSSELFGINRAHLQHEDSLLFSQKWNETVTSHVIDTSTKSELEINRLLGNNPHNTSANDMQDNLVIIQDVVDGCGKLASNVSDPTDLVQSSTESEDKSGEDVYSVGDASAISASVSFSVSAVCTNSDLEFEPERISSLLHESISSEEIQTFNARINDPREPSQSYTDAKNLEAIKPEDFSKKPYSQNKGSESAQDKKTTNRIDKVIPALTQIPENDSTDKDATNEQIEGKVGATHIAEQHVRVPSSMLADTMVKEAIEAALFEMTGDEGRMPTFTSLKAKPLKNNAQFSKQKVTTVLNLTSKRGEPSRIHVTDEQNTKTGDHVTETSTMHVQMKKVASNAAQKNIEEERSPRINLRTRSSPLLSEDIVHPDMLPNCRQSSELVQNLTADFQMVEEDSAGGTTTADIGKGVASLVKMGPDLQEEAEKTLSCEITEISERIPETIYGLKNCEIKQMHTEVGKQMAVNLAELPGEERHYKKGNENVNSIKVTQNCNVSEIDYTHNYSVSDVKESIEVGKVDLEKEETYSIKNTLYGKADECLKYTQIHNVTVITQMATEALLTPELTAGEEGGHEMSVECEKVDMNGCEIDSKTVVKNERERDDMLSQSIGAHYFEKIESFHDTQYLSTNRSTNQNAAKPNIHTRLGATMYTLSETKGKKNRVATPPKNSELSNNHKCLDPVMLISTPIKEDNGKETNSDAVSDIHPYLEQIKPKEGNEKIQKVEQTGEGCDSNVDSINSRLNSEPFANAITLKSTVWKVCYFVLFVVFLVTIYHYDFIGCFALYLFSMYWLYCEGEASSDSVRKN